MIQRDSEILVDLGRFGPSTIAQVHSRLSRYSRMEIVNSIESLRLKGEIWSYQDDGSRRHWGLKGSFNPGDHSNVSLIVP